MRKTIPAVIVLLLTAGFLQPAPAQSGQRVVERLTPIGVERSVEFLSTHTGSVRPGGSLQAAGGLLWNYPSPSGMPWISQAVAIGQRGTQVIVGEHLNFERVHLFSVDDANPPTSIWADTSLNTPQSVDAADSSHTGDFHVILYRSSTSVVVNLYRSGSPVPAWTWSPPFTNVGTARVAIDRQPSVVAVGVVDNTTKQIHLYFLDPRTGAQLNTYSQATQYGLRGWDLSADGSTLYFHDGGYGVNIFDILTNQVVFQTQTGGSFDGHCISGDGTRFAFGGFGHVKLWEKTSSGWQMYNFPTGTGNYGDEMDFSDDGTTLGFGVSQYSPSYGRTEAYMMDVASRKITAHVVNTSNGNYQDVCSAAAISHDGKYFVLGRWGDDLQTNPEVQILENGQGLVGSIACRGSCFSADISWDGQVTVASGKAVHANVMGKGGDVYCWDLGGEDMDLVGAPRLGQMVHFDVYTQPNWYYDMMIGTGDNPQGIPAGAYGTLYLDPSPPHVIIMFPLLPAGPSGVGSLPFLVPNDPKLVGATLFMQAFTTPDGATIKLTRDYLTVNFLP